MKHSLKPTVWITLAAFAALAGCGGVGDALGVAKRPPDEFAVVSTPSLIIPPEYHLRPPRAAQPRASDVDSQILVMQALFPDRTELPPPSAGQQSLLRDADALGADPSVRNVLTDNVPYAVSKGNLTEELLRSEITQSETARLERVAPESASQ